MSFVIEVNGVKVEAETLKEANKLAKREEKRQALGEEEKKAKQEKAYQRAYAEVGLLACHPTRNIWIWQTYRGVKQDGEYTNLLVEQETTGTFRTAYPVSTVLAYPSGQVYGARVADPYDGPVWFAFGVYESELAVAYFPPFLAEILEKAYQAELSKALAQSGSSDIAS